MNNLTRRIVNVVLPTLVAGSCLLMLTPGMWAKGNAKAGKSLFDAKCAMCHAGNGSGDCPMGKGMKVPDLRSKDIQKQTDAEIYGVISKGKGTMMPHYAGQLSKAQIGDLVAYIRTLKK